MATAISGDLNEVTDLAGENPALLLFAERKCHPMFQQRATSLAWEVSFFCFEGRETNLKWTPGRKVQVDQTRFFEREMVDPENPIPMECIAPMYFAQMKGFIKALESLSGFTST